MLTDKANAWVQRGYLVEIATYAQRGRAPFYTLERTVKLIDLDIPYKSKGSLRSFYNLSLLPLHFIRLFQFINNSKPDVVLVANCGLEYFLFPFLRKATKSIKEEHLSKYEPLCTPVSLSIRSIYENFKRCFLTFYDAYVALNKDEIKFGPEGKSVEIPNPIKLEATESSFFQSREKVIISIGRLTPIKQYDHLIEIFFEVYKVHPEWKLKIVGEGSQLLKLKNKITELALEDAVYLTGITNEVELELAKASIFALTSRTESFSMAILEAMRNELPVVSYDSPYGPRNIIHDEGDGFLIKLNDKASFAEAICSLIEKPIMRMEMGQRGRLNVKRFEIGEVMKKWDKLFNSLGLKT